MTWNTYWFIVFLIELGIWSYVLILNHDIKQLQHKNKRSIRIIVKPTTKKDIVRG